VKKLLVNIYLIVWRKERPHFNGKHFIIKAIRLLKAMMLSWKAPTIDYENFNVEMYTFWKRRIHMYSSPDKFNSSSEAANFFYRQ
jgi:hypothetical protein